MSSESDGGDALVEYEQPRGERWDPLGATNEESEPEEKPLHCTFQCIPHDQRVRALEEEQELLNASLLQLTTHFAQVQFRLSQVVDAPADQKEHLLRSLEEFAFRGVTVTEHTLPRLTQDCADHQSERLAQRHKQLELIEQLKAQLAELEKFTFTSSEEDTVPGHILERLDELKVNLKDSRQEGDGAQSTITPLRMREQLVAQFKTQIADLERFIEFLQEGGGVTDTRKCTCQCPVHGHVQQNTDLRQQSFSMIRRAASLLQMFILVQLGCGVQPFRRNNLKNCYNHYGDLRARLEVIVARLEEALRDQRSADEEYSSESEEGGGCRVTALVRKQLAPAVRDLLQHGLMEKNERSTALSLPLLGCWSGRAAAVQQPRRAHAWELLLDYYELKNGERYNTTPARKLSQSFNLQMADTAVSNKQSLLATIGSIMSTHARYKRSYDAQFKAFVCAALNANKLVVWLGTLLQCKRVVLARYQSWSYVLRTGFQDSLQTLDKLSHYRFSLPEDLAVRHFQNIKDVFM